MRRYPQQSLPFAQGFTNQPKFAMLQVTQATMNQPRGPAGGVSAEFTFIKHQYFQPAQSCISGNAGAIDATAHNSEIELGHARSIQLER